MKFQKPSLKFFGTDGQTDRCMDRRTDGRTSQNQYAPHFFKVGGIKRHEISVTEARVIMMIKPLSQ